MKGKNEKNSKTAEPSHSSKWPSPNVTAVSGRKMALVELSIRPQEATIKGLVEGMTIRAPNPPLKFILHYLFIGFA